MRTAGSLIAAYGLYVFWKRNFIDYLFLRSEFVFMDYGEPVVLFYLEYPPLWGQTLHGKVISTIVRGRVVMEDDKILAEPGYGRFIRG